MIGPVAQKQYGANGHDSVKQQLALLALTFRGLAMKYLSAQSKRYVLLAIVFSFLLIPSLLAQDSFFDSDGVKIHYVVEGKGEPLLVIHGFTGSIQGMSDAIKYLSNNFQVIAMDCRGHGQSDKPHDLDAYGMNMIQDQIRLLDHLKIKKTHVFGYSMGGAIAIGIVGFHPERVISAIVGGAGWVAPGQVRDMAGLDWDELAESMEQGKGLAPLTLALIPEGDPQPTPEQLEMAKKEFNSTQDPLALAALIRNFVPSPTEAQIRSNKIHVLALIGDKDPGKKDVDRLDGLMPNLKIVVIPNADHMTATADPLFHKSFSDFLSENSLSKSGK
jgi:pimeloyl-ACP methyl ester carboxylesterase